MSARRSALTLLAGWAAGWPAIGQVASRQLRIGWVGATALSESYSVAFVDRLAELGYVKGRNLTIEYRQTEQFEPAWAELAGRGCDIFFAPGNALNAAAALKATRDKPIVIVANDYDPVGARVVASLARPGGRVTGVSQLVAELPAKRLELLKEMLPQLQRVGVLSDAATVAQLEVARAAASKLGLQLIVHAFTQHPYGYEAAFEALARQRAEAVMPLSSGFFARSRRTITQLALRRRLATATSNRVWAEQGSLMSYGPNFSASYRRAAEMVAKLIDGAPAATMPVEQPQVVEVVINLGTARALGIAVPQSLKLRADALIE